MNNINSLRNPIIKFFKIINRDLTKDLKALFRAAPLKPILSNFKAYLVPRLRLEAVKPTQAKYGSLRGNYSGL